MSTSEALIDSIYEAAVVPDLWPNVLTEITKLTDSAWGAIVAVREGMMHANDALFIGTPRAHEIFAYYLSIGAPFPNKRVAYAGADRMHGFITDLDMFKLDEIENDPWYTQLMRPFGGGWFAGTGIASLTGDLVAINVERAHALGPYTQQHVAVLDSIRPHLARAGLLSARLSLEKAKSETDALERIGIAAAVLDHRGRIRSANPKFATMIPSIMRDRNERVSFVDKMADKLLSEAVNQLNFSKKSIVCSIALSANQKHAALIAHLIPICRTANDIFSAGGNLMIVAGDSPRGAPNAVLLHGLFDLSPSEARVARALAAGLELAEISKLLGIARETVRTHVKRILEKTGTRRQAEVAILLNNLAFPIKSN